MPQTSTPYPPITSDTDIISCVLKRILLALAYNSVSFERSTVINPRIQTIPKAKSAKFILKYWSNTLKKERISKFKKWCAQISQLLNYILTGKKNEIWSKENNIKRGLQLLKTISNHWQMEGLLGWSSLKTMFSMVLFIIFISELDDGTRNMFY